MKWILPGVNVGSYYQQRVLEHHSLVQNHFVIWARMSMNEDFLEIEKYERETSSFRTQSCISCNASSSSETEVQVSYQRFSGLPDNLELLSFSFLGSLLSGILSTLSLYCHHLVLAHLTTFKHIVRRSLWFLHFFYGSIMYRQIIIII